MSSSAKKNEKKRPRPSFIISDDEQEDPAMAQSSQGFFDFEMDDGHDEDLANALPPSPIATPLVEDDDAAILSTPPKKARRKLSYGKPTRREIEQTRRLKVAHAQKRGGVLTQELENKIASEKTAGKKGAGSGAHLSLLALEVVRDHNNKEEEEDSKNGGEKEKSAQKKEREEEEKVFKVRPNPKKTGSLTDKPNVVQATDAIRCGDKMIVCSDRPDQNVSDPDRLLCLLYIFVAAIFLRFGGGEIKHYRFVSQLIKSLPLYFARLHQSKVSI